MIRILICSGPVWNSDYFFLTEQISEYIRKGEIMANEYPNIFGEGWMTE